MVQRGCPTSLGHPSLYQPPSGCQKYLVELLYAKDLEALLGSLVEVQNQSQGEAILYTNITSSTTIMLFVTMK